MCSHTLQDKGKCMQCGVIVEEYTKLHRKWVKPITSEPTVTITPLKRKQKQTMITEAEFYQMWGDDDGSDGNDNSAAI